MAEKLIARQTGNQVPPELRKKFSEVHQYESNGRIVIWGIDKASKRRRQIGYKKLIKAFSKDPDAKFKPEPAQGVWHSGGGERAVTVVGTQGIDKEGRPLMRIQGSNERVPRGEIKWIDSNEPASEVKELRTEMDRRLKEMEKRLDDLTARNTELESENQRLSTRNEELESQLQTYKDRLDNYGPVPVVSEPDPTESESRARRGWNRTTGWVGRRLPGNSAPAYENAYIEARDGEPVIVTRETTVDEYSDYERRRGAAAVIGAAAVAGAVLLIAWAWGEHKEHEGPDRTTTVTLPATPHVTHDTTAGVGQRQEPLFHGGKAFKVSLPGNLEWEENDNGPFRIDDTKGHHIVPHVYWDQQGNLDVDSRQLLLTTPYHDFHLEQKSYPYHTPGTDYDSHYETVVLNA